MTVNIQDASNIDIVTKSRMTILQIRLMETDTTKEKDMIVGLNLQIYLMLKQVMGIPISDIQFQVD